MSAKNEVIFERKISDGWQPVQFKELHIGDITRMKTVAGQVLRGEDGVEVYEVVATGGPDPDTHCRTDMSLFPAKG